MNKHYQIRYVPRGFSKIFLKNISLPSVSVHPARFKFFHEKEKERYLQRFPPLLRLFWRLEIYDMVANLSFRQNTKEFRKAMSWVFIGLPICFLAYILKLICWAPAKFYNMI